MGQWINRDFTRPDPQLIRDLGQMPSSILGDCLNRLQTLDASIRPLKTGWRFSGPAFTVQSVESCNWGAHQALAMAKPGDVLVIAARGGTMAAVWGHVMTFAARQVGLAGVVIDGCTRDAAENSADSLPIFCKGICAGGPHKGWPCNLNVPVSCAGVPVLPGDIVVGDDDGIVIVPALRAYQVLDEARRRVEMEKDWYRRLEEGETTIRLLGLDPA